MTMATMGPAKAVWDHAHQYYDIGVWRLIVECWHTLAILEALDQVEERTSTPFLLDAVAIDHFSRIVLAFPKGASLTGWWPLGYVWRGRSSTGRTRLYGCRKVRLG
jgi:hypothetical protein